MTAPSDAPGAPNDLTPEELAAWRESGGVLQACAQHRPRPLCRQPDCQAPMSPSAWRAARQKLCAKPPPARPQKPDR